MARRSVLFSPGDQPELLRKAQHSGADVAVFDLEDGVAPASKERAREAVCSLLRETDAACERCVRLNPLDAGGEADLDCLLDKADRIDALLLPKVDSPGDVRALANELDDAEVSIPIFALLETAGGVLDAPAIAAQTRVDALLFGAEDLAADIGATRTTEGGEISYARQRVVLAASNAGIDAIDTLVTDFEETEQLEADTRRAVEFGFDGKMAIHPRQVTVINEAFTPDDDQIEWARRVLDARDDAAADDRAVFTVDGEMIDAPLIAQAERILERARAAEAE